MTCPNCDKRPVGMLQSFRLNGVTLKDKINGYFRCRHCGQLLRQSRGVGQIAKFEKGFWWRYLLFTLFAFGGIMGTVSLIESWELSDGYLLGIFMVLLIGYLTGLEEISVRYWIIKEADREEDQKQFARMGIVGWILLCIFLVIMIGGLIAVDKYVDTAEISLWQQIVGLILYVLVIVGGALGIFHYFSEKEGKSENNLKRMPTSPGDK